MKHRVCPHCGGRPSLWNKIIDAIFHNMDLLIICMLIFIFMVSG